MLQTDLLAAAVRDNPSFLTGLADSLACVAWAVDADERFTAISGRAADSMGLAPERVVGRPLATLFPPDRPEFESILAAHRSTLAGRGGVYEANDFRGRCLQFYLHPQRGPGGGVVGCLGLAFDVTESRRTERILRTNMLATRTLNEASDLPDALPPILRAVCETEGWEYGEYFALDPDTRTLRQAGVWHRPGGPLEELQAATADLSLNADDESLPGRVARSGRPTWVADLAADPNFSRPAQTERAGLHGAVAFPVVSAAATIGVLVFFGRQVREPDPSLTHLMAAIGIQFGRLVERKHAETEVRLLGRAIESFTQGVCITDAGSPDNPIVYANAGFLSLTGYSRGEVVGRNCRFLQGPGTDPAAVAEVRRAIREGRACFVELLNYRKDGAPFWNALSVCPVHDAAGRLTHIVGVQTDITPMKRLEDQFRQSQKMEAIGRLAGGVAHDFNNLLTVINGYSDLLLARPCTAPDRQLLVEIQKAGMRAATLTRQLLAFSRQQVLEPRVLDLNRVVADMEGMLRRLIGEDVTLVAAGCPAVWPVRADAGQVEQVVMNLAVNARDAMPDGGRLTVETANVHLDAAHHPEVRPGRYAMLAVSDTGTGMTPEVQARLFEPFFTTKGPGKGTGLGLSTVYGIVKQSGGHIDTRSEPGRGTTFRVFLPAVEGPATADPPAASDSAPAAGVETVLVAEDEDAVREIIGLTLRSHGYTVLEAGSGAEAIRIAETHGGPIHLLVTDVVMPGMGGRELIERLTALRPGIRVLCMSGYTDDAVVRQGVLEANTHFIQKPFTPGVLADKIRRVLG